MNISKLGLIALTFAATQAYAGENGNSGLVTDYLEPFADVGEPIYTDGVAKITFNCNTREYVLRAHGLAAAKNFELRSGGEFDDAEGNYSVAVGNGIAGLGNNVLIKGDLSEESVGDYWNLWEVTYAGQDDVELTDNALPTRVLQGLRTKCPGEGE
ncbi:hypothetical protein L9G16_05185 [Shewanella sp. A25]|nr:hypothetical protein [Shewanella shenzhenensis]